MPIFYLVATLFDPGSVARTLVILIGYFLLAVFFVLRFKVPKPGVKKILILIAILLVILSVLIGLHIAIK